MTSNNLSRHKKAACLCQVCGRRGILATFVRNDTSKGQPLPYSLCDFHMKIEGRTVRSMYDVATTEVIQHKVMSFYISEAEGRVREAQRRLQESQDWLNELQNWSETP